MTETITVTTAHGKVRGRHRPDSYVCYGLPYAQPPVGALAFAPPVRPQGWAGVRDATAVGPTAQTLGFTNGTIPEPSVGGDDILTVNVFTPDPSPEVALPVMVWIHGGAYIAGSPVSPWYDGASFTRQGIVVVTIGYRLGVAGFGLIEGATPNRGVLDWLCALEWVQDNIRCFGGDPGRVTIAGQSAGGGAVLTLLGLDRADALVHGAIAMSPVTVPVSIDAAERSVTEIGTLLGVSPSVGGLTGVSRKEIAEVVWRMRNVFGAAPGRDPDGRHPIRVIRDVLSSLELSPVQDGDVVRTSPIEGARAARGVPLLLGSVAHEFNSMIAPGASSVGPERLALELLGVSPADAAAYVRERAPLSKGELLGQVLSDLLIRSAVPRIAEARERTWAYDFRWAANGDRDTGKAFHCVDVPFAWGVATTPDARRVIGDPPHELADAVHAGWASFVTNGDPGWQEYGSDRAVRCFGGAAPMVSDGYLAERMLAGLPYQ